MGKHGSVQGVTSSPHTTSQSLNNFRFHMLEANSSQYAHSGHFSERISTRMLPQGPLEGLHDLPCHTSSAGNSRPAEAA
eukprot:CAMPEP_0204190234 /NCGR_PEP_ID=MMETSP0361-20130328/59152_1 /ASSEMBLY_ACC=CAM_ASM_000343 /TAXON_ID=268821 /ORGANISM="Scrippsiella Hangoei, Strain SHTV-5" /LENGTH=78 /DNA_ID=CAMNT_0051151023 /DNA_START=330 /DNA_END=567 /DNA_ORIENTATION=+